MAGNTNFPTSLDDNTSLIDVTNGVTSLEAAHHNNLKEAIKALETKVGVDFTLVPTTLDYRLGHPTNGHRHDGASGQGPQINPSTVPAPSGAYPSGALNLHDHLMSFHPTIVPSVINRWTEQIQLHGSALVGSNLAAPVVMGRTAIIENVSAALRRGASGATAAFIARVGPTNIHGASVGLGIRFAPGATRYGQPSPNLGTYPSGAIITLDAEAVGSNDPGQDLSVIFVFRE